MKKQSELELIILGNVQDAGFPHANCYKNCCAAAWNDFDKRRFTSCIAIVDKANKQWFLIDATPDIKEQLNLFRKTYADYNLNPDAIFLTHAHVGHYTGLMQFGRESISSKNLPVYAMPKMTTFLQSNAPYTQLLNYNNIQLHSLKNETSINLSSQIKIIPFLVPHRDEYTETVGFKIETENKKVLFIPDIDDWNIWNKDILEEIRKVDYAFLDGSFYDKNEMPNVDMSKIPHPTITKSMKLFEVLPENDRNKIFFTHFNHSNPVLRNTKERQFVIDNYYFLAEQGKIFNL